jgi:hypothetical protein
MKLHTAKIKRRSGGELPPTIFFAALRHYNLPIPQAEYKFHNKRKFKFDYAYPDLFIAIEVEGGVFTRQAHGSVKGILRDIEKYTLAASLGYKIIRVLPSKLLLQETMEIIRLTIVNAVNTAKQINDKYSANEKKLS